MARQFVTTPKGEDELLSIQKYVGQRGYGNQAVRDFLLRLCQTPRVINEIMEVRRSLNVSYDDLSSELVRMLESGYIDTVEETRYWAMSESERERKGIECPSEDIGPEVRSIAKELDKRVDFDKLGKDLFGQMDMIDRGIPYHERYDLRDD